METILYVEDIPQRKSLQKGIFWVLADNGDMAFFQLITFEIPCNRYGVIIAEPKIPLNSKNGKTYNHKRLWQEVIQKDVFYRPYNKRAYDYYPRGRVEITNDKAVIYLNPNINRSDVVNEIKRQFGLYEENIAEVRILNDNSAHYQCFIDRK